MHADPLIRMANQIGSFFEAMPDRAEALEGIVHHIRKFWDPRMRTALMKQVDGGTASELSPMVVEALARHRSVLF